MWFNTVMYMRYLDIYNHTIIIVIIKRKNYKIHNIII